MPVQTPVLDRPADDLAEDDVPTDGLFRVWFDVDCGCHPEPCWWCEDPEPLAQALATAADGRARGFSPIRVMPDGMNPRPDGRWDNPV